MRGAVVVGAVLVLAGLLGPAGARAHVGGPGLGLAITTDGPDLRSVTVGPGEPSARFCFDDPVATASPAGLALWGYDPNRFWTPTDVTVAGDDARCVIARFPAGTEVTQATVGATSDGAITGTGGQAGDVGSEPVTGSVVTPRPGATTGPDVLDARVDAQDLGHVKAIFTYDEPLAPVGKRRQFTADPNDDPGASEVVDAPYVGSAFAYRTAAGDQVTGPGTPESVTVDGATVTVDFGPSTGLVTAARLIAGYNAVQDKPATGAVLGRETWTPSSYAAIRPPGTPDLPLPEPVSAAAGSAPGAYTLTFSRPVTVRDSTPSRIKAIADDGLASSVVPTVTATDDRTLAVSFGAPVSADPGGTVALATLGGAVADTGTGADAVVGQVGLTPPGDGFSRPGYTAGPDLLAVVPDPATGRVAFRYDEAVFPGSAGATDFRAVTAARVASFGSDAPTVDGATVTVPFSSDAGAAVGYTNAATVLVDPSGRPSITQSVARDREPLPEPPAPPPAAPPATEPGPPATVPTAPRPTVTTGRKRVAVKRVSLRVERRRYTGRLTVARACRTRRTVLLVRVVGRHTRTVARTRTDGQGRFAFPRRSSTRGRRIRVVVRASHTKTVSCLTFTAPQHTG